VGAGTPCKFVAVRKCQQRWQGRPRTLRLSQEGSIIVSMRFVVPLPLVLLTLGCRSAWEPRSIEGPWCAPNVRAKVYYRNLPGINGHGEFGYANKSGVKQGDLAFLNELDHYFAKCAFIDQWPVHGYVNATKHHESPFDLCLVSIDPTIIMGVERKDPRVSSLHAHATNRSISVGSTFLLDGIEVRTTLPYHTGAHVVWFSPAADHDLHPLDVANGKASFSLANRTEIDVTVVGDQLTTSRK
jgi:hypothetical protein